eukprot:151341-Prymnesium_polylepis.2
MPLAVYALVKVAPSNPTRSMFGVRDAGATGRLNPGSAGACQPALSAAPWMRSQPISTQSGRGVGRVRTFPLLRTALIHIIRLEDENVGKRPPILCGDGGGNDVPTGDEPGGDAIDGSGGDVAYAGSGTMLIPVLEPPPSGPEVEPSQHGHQVSYSKEPVGRAYVVMSPSQALLPPVLGTLLFPYKPRHCSTVTSEPSSFGP